jgi:hypothetical protein
MKFTETPWEKVNLGKNSAELTIESADDVFEIEQILENSRFEYLVAKASVKNFKSLQFLQNNGFQFIETQISLSLNLKNKIFDKFRSLTENFGFKKIDSINEFNTILENITDDTFSTDRIARDPAFGLKAANQRYKNWMSNEFGKTNIEIFNLTENTANVGFLMTRSSEKEDVDLLIGGIYSKYQGAGYGYNFIYQPIKHYSSLGKKKIRTKVSSNNLNIIKLYLSLGYAIENMDYVLIKHCCFDNLT